MLGRLSGVIRSLGTQRRLRLSTKEKKIIEKRKQSFEGSKPLEYVAPDRNLHDINFHHQKDFVNEIIGLSKRFPGETIRILNEGVGQSTFKRDLERKLQGKVKMQIVTTDIQKAHKPDVVAVPEELAKTFGRNSFHLVESTFGGVYHTPLFPPKKAISNVIEILKPGGLASVIIIMDYAIESELGKFLGKYKNIEWQIGGLLAFRTLTIRKKTD
ncbi:MAG TPA: hypothetical protein VFF13_01890 [archaeon]|nr:hypothetical protein [archaeon]